MMSAKIATLSLVKIKVFSNEDYDVKSNILSRESKYFVAMIMWSKFSDYNITMKEVIIISILKGY